MSISTKWCRWKIAHVRVFGKQTNRNVCFACRTSLDACNQVVL